MAPPVLIIWDEVRDVPPEIWDACAARLLEGDISTDGIRTDVTP